MSEIGENLMGQGQASKAGEELFASRECPKQGVKFAESDEEVHCHQINYCIKKEQLAFGSQTIFC